MEILNFIFRLGVVFAIFGFIWGIINLGLLLLIAGRKRTLNEVYLIKNIKYILLVDVVFLICYDNIIYGLDYNTQLVLGAIILIMYFLGKLQQKQNIQRVQLFYVNLNSPVQQFNLLAEIITISIATGVFILFWFQPQWAFNSISIWFQESILNIEDTPIFGFIFKVIGFFFVLNIIRKVINSFLMLITGQGFKNNNDDRNDRFDPYQEIK